MSQLHKAPLTTNQNQIEKWFVGLTEEEKLAVIRDISSITNELHGILINATIPNMKLSTHESVVRDVVATHFLRVINEMGFEVLSKAAQTLFENPDMDALPPEEKPSNG